MIDLQATVMKFWAKQVDSGHLRLEIPSLDFIPYACHFDKNTILTKNGELIQTIRIVGFSYDNVGKKQFNLRENVRKALASHVVHDNFALYFHTVRQKRNLSPGGNYKNHFTNKTNQAWIKKNYWHDKYVNELYITFVTEGHNFPLSDIKELTSSLTFSPLNNKHTEHLERSLIELQSVVDKVMGQLQEYGAERLGIVIGEQGAYSELLKFLDKIIHLVENKVPVPVMDLSKYLAEVSLMAFARNKFEIKRRGFKSHFGSILSIKEYHDFSTAAIDRFIQLPVQFVITQSMTFTSHKKALKNYKYTDYILQVSGDELLAQASGIDQLFAANQGNNTDYADLQTTIMLIEEDQKKLDEVVSRAAQELSKLGLIAVLEDIHLEQCFWAQLPANFRFLSRQSPIVATDMAGFALLQNYPAGYLQNIWGNALTILRTVIGTPYFFNFHLGQVGHSFILGPDGSGKTTISNFLLAEACKYDPQIFMIDGNCTSDVFCRALDGIYNISSLTRVENIFTFNPLQLPDDPHNRSFLQAWFLSLTVDLNGEVTEFDQDLAFRLVELNYSLQNEQRRLSHLVKELGNILADHPSAMEKLSPWYGDGQFAAIFDNETDNFDVKTMVQALDVEHLLPHGHPLLTPYIFYCFYRFNLSLSGKPAIFVLDNALKILDNKFIAGSVTTWLDYLTAHNAMVIFKDDLKEKFNNPELIDVLQAKIVTQIFLPYPDMPMEVGQTIYALAKEDLLEFKAMDPNVPSFMLRQSNHVMFLELNLFGMKNILEVLSSNKKLTAKMNEAIVRAGERADQWLPVFDEYFKQ
jgi:type IV secretion system protein VirB4